MNTGEDLAEAIEEFRRGTFIKSWSYPFFLASAQSVAKTNQANDAIRKTILKRFVVKRPRKYSPAEMKQAPRQVRDKTPSQIFFTPYLRIALSRA